jgi:hypothetical protein
MAVSASDLRAVLAIPSTPAAPTPAQKKVARKEQRVRRELAALVGPRAAAEARSSGAGMRSVWVRRMGGS